MCKYNPFRPLVDPIKKPSLMFRIFTTAKLCRIILISVLIIPGEIYIETNYKAGLPALFLCLLSCLFLVVSACKSSKFSCPVSNSYSNMSIQDLYEKYPNDLICPYCSIVRDQDTRHCHHCKKCIDGFDHHCIWFNNCIGKK